MRKKAIAQRSAATCTLSSWLEVPTSQSSLVFTPTCASICTSAASPVITIQNPLHDLCNMIPALRRRFPSDVSNRISNELSGVLRAVPTLGIGIAKAQPSKTVAHRYAIRVVIDMLDSHRNGVIPVYAITTYMPVYLWARVNRHLASHHSGQHNHIYRAPFATPASLYDHVSDSLDTKRDP